MELKSVPVKSNDVRVPKPEVGSAYLVERYSAGSVKAVILHPDDFAELQSRAQMLEEAAQTGRLRADRARSQGPPDRRVPRGRDWSKTRRLSAACSEFELRGRRGVLGGCALHAAGAVPDIRQGQAAGRGAGGEDDRRRAQEGRRCRASLRRRGEGAAGAPLSITSTRGPAICSVAPGRSRLDEEAQRVRNSASRAVHLKPERSRVDRRVGGDDQRADPPPSERVDSARRSGASTRTRCASSPSASSPTGSSICTSWVGKIPTVAERVVQRQRLCSRAW